MKIEPLQYENHEIDHTHTHTHACVATLSHAHTHSLNQLKNSLYVCALCILIPVCKTVEIQCVQL